MLTRDQPYHNLGADYFTDRLDPQHKARQALRLLDQLHHLGYSANLHPIAAG